MGRELQLTPCSQASLDRQDEIGNNCPIISKPLLHAVFRNADHCDLTLASVRIWPLRQAAVSNVIGIWTILDEETENGLSTPARLRSRRWGPSQFGTPILHLHPCYWQLLLYPAISSSLLVLKSPLLLQPSFLLTTMHSFQRLARYNPCR